MRHGEGKFVSTVELNGEGQGGLIGKRNYEYNGEFVKDQFHGQGTMKNFDMWAGQDDWGCTYEGKFELNKASGYGKQTCLGGDTDETWI